MPAILVRGRKHFGKSCRCFDVRVPGAVDVNEPLPTSRRGSQSYINAIIIFFFLRGENFKWEKKNIK